MSGVVGRFAPTPSGELHLGNLFCSLLAWLSAKSQGGEIVLRIEDLDRDRSRESYTLQCEHDLALLGLVWDEGGTAGGNAYLQSKRDEVYEAAFQTLAEKGLVYPCFCTRAELHAVSAPHAEDGELRYPGTCRALRDEEIAQKELQRRPAWRVRVPEETISFCDGHYGQVEQNLQQTCGDFVLRRSDGIFAYQLAVVADDAAMGVTEVVRGADLLTSTPRQIYLFEQLGLPVPRFAHVPLLLDEQGKRLAKRDHSQSLTGLLEQGETPESVVGKLAFLAGLLDRPEAASAKELIPLFDWEKVPTKEICLPDGLFLGKSREGERR